jgi:hypothetical protein
LNNITAGVRKRKDANRTREAGGLDEIQGVVANRLRLHCNGAVGFIDWLGLFATNHSHRYSKDPILALLDADKTGTARVDVTYAP